MREIEIQVPDGFQKSAKELVVTSDRKALSLLSRHQERYCCAEHTPAGTKLLSKYYICPSCGKATPAFKEDCHSAAHMECRRRHSRSEISRWLEHEYSLFDVDNKLVLHDQNRPEDKVVFQCPNCDFTSQKSEARILVRLTKNKHSVTMTVEPQNVTEVLSDIAKMAASIEFPLSEKLVFNPRKKRIFKQIIDGKGQVLRTRDVTLDDGAISKSCGYSILQRSLVVRRKLGRLLFCENNERLFANLELTARNLADQVRFAGFSRSFYDAVPYDEAGQLDASFRDTARKLVRTRSDEFPRVYGNLPEAKSIRRMVFCNQAFFWYLPEIGKLWFAIKDALGAENHHQAINCLYTILSLDSVFELLALLHQYATAALFVTDYCREKGVSNLLHVLSQIGDIRVQQQIILYTALDETFRERAKAAWKKSKRKNDPHSFSERTFSIPMRSGARRFGKQQSINERFYFEWLQSGSDYARAGKQLNNCLGRLWKSDNNPVCVIKDGSGRLFAAIEIKGNELLQLRGWNNSNISETSDVYLAFVKWAKANHFIISPGINRRFGGDDDLDDWI